MSNSCSLDLAAKCIKQIVDSIRCIICDRIDEGRSRYGCGHTACSDCVATSQSCLLCLTPPIFESNRVDEPLTCRAKHAADLLYAFQASFHLDVYRQQRISEQLKLEKDLFPQCIQAPKTYFNRRHSSKSVGGRDSHCVFPGEIVTPPKMESSRNFVQEWLESNENEFSKLQPRQALSDLKVNSPRLINSPIKKRADIIHDKIGTANQRSNTKSRKRSIKTALMAARSQSGLDKYLKSTGTRRNAKEVRREFEHHEKTVSHAKNDKEESGIVMDDEPIVIEDSQSQYVDKDRQAWLAVLKACENENDRLSQETVTILDKYPTSIEPSLKRHKVCSDANEHKSKPVRVRVPFYKKGSFLKPFKMIYKRDEPQRDSIQYKVKDFLSITVETQALVTTIQVSNCPKPTITDRISKSIQTDLTQDFVGNIMEKECGKKDKATEMPEKQSEPQLNSIITPKSQDLFSVAPNKNTREIFTPGGNRTYPGLESSSDSEHEHSSLLVVTADIHQCKESDHLQRGILSEVLEAAISRPAKRFNSPVSSDSSNKENHNPNARKKARSDKKSKKMKI